MLVTVDSNVEAMSLICKKTLRQYNRRRTAKRYFTDGRLKGYAYWPCLPVQVETVLRCCVTKHQDHAVVSTPSTWLPSWDYGGKLTKLTVWQVSWVPLGRGADTGTLSSRPYPRHQERLASYTGIVIPHPSISISPKQS